jgi:integrase
MTAVFVVSKGKMAGKYCAQESVFDADGKRTYVSGFGSSESAAMMRLGANLERRKRPSVAPVVPRNRVPKRTVASLIAHWQAENSEKLAPEHLLRTRRNIENHLGHLLDVALVDIPEVRVKDEFARLKLATATTPTAYRNVHKSFTLLLNYAVKQGWLKFNPMRNLETVSVIAKVAKADEDYIEYRAEIYRGMLKWLKESGSDDYCWVLFMSLGLRRGELCGLELDSINPANNVIKIDRQYRIASGSQKAGIYPGTKNKRGRSFKLPEFYLGSYLMWWMDKRADIEPVELWAKNQLFPNQWKDGSWHGRNANRLWDDFTNLLEEYGKTIVKNGRVDFDELGIESIDWEALRFRPHYMRHISASFLAHQDVPLVVAQSILGHLDPAMTEHYTHIMKSDQQSALDKATAHLR